MSDTWQTDLAVGDIVQAVVRPWSYMFYEPPTEDEHGIFVRTSTRVNFNAIGLVLYVNSSRNANEQWICLLVEGAVYYAWTRRNGLIRWYRISERT